jgi:hypothetical protein
MTAHGRRAQRSRKRRRSAGAAPAGGVVTDAQTQALKEPTAAASARAGAPGRAARRNSRQPPSGRARERARAKRGARGGLSDMLPLGERPHSLWHPWPLSELLILVGAIGTVVGLSRGVSNGGAPLFAGLAAVAIGTVEVTLREHLSGYRSHAIVLAALPVVVLDTMLVLLIAPFGAGLKLAMVTVDVVLFAVVYRMLRARFSEARRERVFTGGR